MDRKRVARVLDEMAVMLELAGANKFKVRAYENAAHALLGFSGDLESAVQSGELKKVPGIGATIFANVQSLVLTDRLPVYEELRATFPPGLRECLRVPRLGARKLKALHEALRLESLDDLERACREGHVAEIKGFGPKTAEHILRGIAMVRASEGLFLYPAARVRGEALVSALRATGLAGEVSVAGSLRRRREIVRDVDIVASSTRPEEVSAAFRSLPEVFEVIGSGPTKTSVRFLDGLCADLRVVSPEDFPAALLYFTGSREHNTELRARAKRRGWKLNEYGIFRDGEDRIRADSEEALYAALGLSNVEPELREGLGEIEAAENGTLPALVGDEDVRGLIHVHTDASDGRDTLEAMALAARDAGYGYVAFTDHSKSAGYAGGLSEERVGAQREEIRALRKRLPGFRIFHGTEADILADGSIDYGDEFLGELDLVVASIHSRFQLSREEQTARLIKAVRNPLVSVLGHPTGRLLLSREGISADMEAVIDAAAESGCALEVNGSPHRLDLDWRLVRRAVARGVPIAIGPDAHSTRELAYTAYGVGIARKGWAGPADVLNARGPDELAAWLEARRGRALPESRDRASG